MKLKYIFRNEYICSDFYKDNFVNIKHLILNSASFDDSYPLTSVNYILTNNINIFLR